MVVDLETGKSEHLTHHVRSVSPVFGQRLASPLATHQDSSTSAAQVLGVVCLVRAYTRNHARSCVLGLDPVPEPVGALRRARQVAHLLVKTTKMSPSPRTHLLEVTHRVAHGLAQVLGEISDPPISLPARCDDPLDIELLAETHNVGGPQGGVGVKLRVKPIESLLPGGKHFSRIGGDISVMGVIPHGQLVISVDDLGEGRPPDLVIGRSNT